MIQLVVVIEGTTQIQDIDIHTMQHLVLYQLQFHDQVIFLVLEITKDKSTPIELHHI